VLASANLYAEPATTLEFNGDNEVPAVTTKASGSGEIIVNTDRSVSGSIMTTGINATVAHIHAAVAGKNGPVVIPLNMEADGSFSVPANAKLTEVQYKNYAAGNIYVNVHSSAHPGGEIRAQLVQANPAVSESKAEAAPSSIAGTKSLGY
jgi:hypothetical protein